MASLKLHRKKICVKTKNYLSSNHIFVTSSQSSNSVNIFYAAVGCTILFIAILSICTTIYYLKIKETKRNSDNNSGREHMTYLTTTRNTTSMLSYGSFHHVPTYSFIDERSKDLQEHISQLTIQR